MSANAASLGPLLERDLADALTKITPTNEATQIRPMTRSSTFLNISRSNN
jgi:hypothetical protein